MNKLKALAVDIKDSVYDGKSDVMMYVVQDIFAADTVYIFSIPYETFVVSIKESNYEKEIEQTMKYSNHFQTERKEKLKRVMREIIKNWYEYV